MNRDMELTVNVHLEDGSCWADIAELPGCFASGDTLVELVESLDEGISLYLDESPVG
jgi:predicted RNase H-like HicB family nuclease